MKAFLALAIQAAAAAAQPWTLERLFTRPYAWGTRPESVEWSKRGHTLLFLWNAEGQRFLDLYAYLPDSRRLKRLTNLEPEKDPLTHSPAEKDERRQQYLEPPAGLSAFNMSHDGGKAVFTYRGDVYVVNTDGAVPPLRLTRTKAVEANPQLAPDGAKVAFVRDGQLFVQDLSNGQLWQITEVEGENTALESYRWSPDGKQFLYTVRTGAARRLLLPNYSGRLVTADSFARSLAGDRPAEMRTYVTGARGGAPREMERGPWGPREWAFETPEWSPDSTHILECSVHPRLKRAQVLVENAATGKAVVVAEEQDSAWAQPAFAAWSPDSKQVLFTSEHDGWNHLYRVDRTGGGAAQITRGAWEVDNDRMFGHPPQWAGEFIYFASTEDGAAERQFYRIRPDGSGKEKLSRREGLNIGIVSEDGRYTAMLIADLKSPFDLYVNERRVTTSTRPDFAEYPWPETRFVQFPSRRDHKTVQAKLLLPHGYLPQNRNQKPRPAVLFIHGSGYATSVLKQWGSYHDLRYVFNCYLANRGYVILDIDYRGSSGYGREWRTGVYLHMGGADLDDVLGGVDYLESLGNIDMRRIGIWGSSYGGFLTNMAMFLSPDTFRAGASFSAVNDWENYNAFYTEQRLTKPEENPEAYRRSSPIHFSQRLAHPLLIVHGMVDSNVLFQDAVQLSEKLIHEGKDFSQIYYPEENHLFVRDQTLIDAFGRAAEFFDRHLSQRKQIE